MSSIRLYLLDALREGGPMYGHQLKVLAETEHTDEWTDISVGGLYGALKRMSAEGLIEVVRFERDGAYPERQVYGITAAGLVALAATKVEAIRDVVLRADPFDLAISRLDPDRLDSLESSLSLRIEKLKMMVVEARAQIEAIGPELSLAENMVLRHKVERLKADLRWHDALLTRLPEIIADESDRSAN